MNAARCILALGLVAVFGAAQTVPTKSTADVCSHADVHLDVAVPAAPCPIDKATLRIRLHNCSDKAVEVRRSPLLTQDVHWVAWDSEGNEVTIGVYADDHPKIELPSGSFEKLGVGAYTERTHLWRDRFASSPEPSRFRLQFWYTVGRRDVQGADLYPDYVWPGVAYSNVLEVDCSGGTLRVLNSKSSAAGRPARQLARDDVFLTDTIEVPFDAHGGQLRFGHLHDLMMPTEAGEELFWVRGPEVRELRSPGDLRSRVTIASPEQALSLARLKTSPKTFHCFGREVEVVAQSKVNADLMYGDARSASAYGSGPHNGFNGIVSNDKLGDLRVAEVTPSGKGYQVTRLLVTERYVNRYPVCSLVRVVEWVGRDGTFVERSRRAFKPKGSYRWSIMIFM